MTATSIIEELGHKAEALLSQLKGTGDLKTETLQDMYQELLSSNLEETITEEIHAARQPELWETVCEVLYSTLSKYMELIEQLCKEVSKLRTENEDLKEFRSEVKKLKEQVEKLEKEKREESDCLMVGQLAFVVEEAIVDYVLTKVIGPPHKFFIKSIFNMQQAINRKKNFSDVLSDDIKHKEAEKRWNDLQKKLGWKPQHFRCIEFLKADRMDTAHPKVDPSVLRAAIRKREGFQYKSECEELLHMLDKIKQ